MSQSNGGAPLRENVLDYKLEDQVQARSAGISPFQEFHLFSLLNGSKLLIVGVSVENLFDRERAKLSRHIDERFKVFYRSFEASHGQDKGNINMEPRASVVGVIREPGDD